MLYGQSKSYYQARIPEVDNVDMYDDIKAFLLEKNIDIVRFADISELPDSQTQGLNKAIVFCLALSKEFVMNIYNDKPVQHDDFAEKERVVDEVADLLASYINSKGYRAYSQSEKSNLENGNFDEKTKSCRLPHKTVARLAGLGYIGKNNLLITEEYGCAISMCTVLTDAPITFENPPLIQSKCNDCEICKDICPVNAIHGNEWTQAGGRDSIVDVYKCTCTTKCMVNCPMTLRYASK